MGKFSIQLQVARVSAMALATSLSIPAFAQDAAVEPAAEEAPQGGLQDIVVTARRVEERLQDVPLSITAMNAKTLNDNRISQVQDLGASVPNLITGKTSIPGGGQVAIRGVNGQSLPRIGLDSRVGVYLDGVYLARSQGQSFNLPDISRIEVLKGPQGTLFGRNVTAGSINIVTANPTGKFGATLEAGLGSRDRRRYRATVDFPEFNGLSLRVSYMHDEREGDFKNRAAGFRPGPVLISVPAVAATATTPASDAFNFAYTPKKAASSFGYLNSDNVFVAARYEGIDGLTADYKFDYNHQLEANATQNIQGYSRGGSCVAAAIALGGSVNQCGAGSITTPGFTNGVISRPGTITNVGGIRGNFDSVGAQDFSLGFRRPGAKAEPYTAPALIRSYGHNLTLNYEAADYLTVKSITAYRNLKTQVQQNGDGGQFTLMNEFLTAVNPALYPASRFPAGQNTLFPLGYAFQGQEQRQFSQELQGFGSATEWLDYLVGLYYFKEKGFAYQFGSNANATSPGGIIAALNGTNGIPVIQPNGGLNNWGIGSTLAGDYNHSTSESQAIFGRLTVKPVEQVDIVLGGRYTKDEKTGSIPQFMANFLDADPLVQPGRQQVSAFLRQKFDKFTYDGTITYHFSRDANIYARYATAYLAGGAIRNVPFEPETTKAGEIGFKSELFDRKVRFNTAAFYQSSKNSQFNRTSPIPVVLPGQTAITNVTATQLLNLGSAKVKGFEAELTAAPIDGLTLNGSVGYAKQTFASPFAGVAPGKPIAPEWTLQGSVQYDTQPIIGDAYLSIRLDANYRSHYEAQTIPTTPALGLPRELLALYGLPTATAADVAASTQTYTDLLVKNGRLGGFWLANARISLVDVPIGGTKGRISGYVRNMFNEKHGLSYLAFYGISAGGTFVERRSFGLDLSVEF
ncbi:TonB-dependent receptor [Sphingomonas montanisoli]|uniref:TonB-dependent receptor n=1 Tax=Sphingomonas montanisoli TaxID=2606412 RepID=A0A5D9CAN7_9SPHN|nr:TonB-dependent receptor [Sphingomonas montanisoli]TZG28779.1 TonB-dependent receptor [Sphingomonas montanisoli]